MTRRGRGKNLKKCVTKFTDGPSYIIFYIIAFLFFYSVLQKAFIEVNEEGTEAAAATIAQFVPLSASFPIPFTCDRPFLFLIRDNESRLTLFTGHVTDPANTLV